MSKGKSVNVNRNSRLCESTSCVSQPSLGAFVESLRQFEIAAFGSFKEPGGPAGREVLVGEDLREKQTNP